MKTETYVYKTISTKLGRLEVLRTRTSAGHVSITIRQSDQSASRDNEITFEGGDYEQEARKLIEMLHAVISNPCELPKAGDG